MSKPKLALGWFLALAASAPVCGADGPARKYSVSIDSKVALKSAKGTAAELKAVTRFDYAFAPAGPGKITSSIDGIELTTSIDGKPGSTTKMNKDQFATPGPDGAMRTIAAKDAPPQLQAMLAQFGKPLATHILADDGEEVAAPVLLITEGILFDTNAYALSRVFHVKFPPKENKWTTSVKMPMGQGQFAVGDVTFEKVGLPGSDGSTRVKVAGTLKAEGQIGAAKIVDGTYELKGLQIYSPKLHDWSSGTYDMTISFDAEAAGQGKFNGKGTMALILKTRP